jgi:hypothetical protein
MSGAKWFDEHGWIVRDIPAEAVPDCHHAGACDEGVEYWRKKLGFEVPRKLAIEWLADFGAWTREELAEAEPETLAERVLWLACADIAEQGEWLGLVH